jgi:hypothetical protein
VGVEEGAERAWVDRAAHHEAPLGRVAEGEAVSFEGEVGVQSVHVLE